jgi:hypothetical protein
MFQSELCWGVVTLTWDTHIYELGVRYISMVYNIQVHFVFIMNLRKNSSRSLKPPRRDSPFGKLGKFFSLMERPTVISE